MRVSYKWLEQWVDSGLDAAAAAEQYTMTGCEVSAVKPAGPELAGVVVGEVEDCSPHPAADRLSVCTVAAGGSQRVTVVCGAPNARAGLKSPLATVGAVLPGGVEVHTARLRGVDSEGMLCSPSELGLGEDAAGLLELPDDAPLGKPLGEYLDLADHVLEFDLTPNRGDCLSVRGLSRELAAVTGSPLQPPEIDPVPAESERDIAVELLDPGDCPRYAGRVIEGIDAAARSPLWLVEKLRRSGMRSLGPVVDVTNYVMLELGQPMHAFDLDRIDGGIRVRLARKGDRITLLDGQVVEPEPDMLMICDHRGPVALAGIMGGADSAVDATTRDILLESAWFNPSTIMGRARRLGLATESAHRFERGVDPMLQALAIERATALIVKIAGGRPGPVVDACERGRMPASPEIELRLERVNRVLGTGFGSGEVKQILDRLGMQCSLAGNHFRVVPASARRDIEIEADLIEEVARVAGFDRLPSRAPGGRLHISLPAEQQLPASILGERLAARGFQEIMTWSFVARAELERLGLEDGAQELANPLSRDMAILRTSLLPGLLRAASANMRRQQERLRLFELGHVFRNSDSGFIEAEHLGLLITGPVTTEHWNGTDRVADFFDLKGEVEQMLAANGRLDEATFEPADRVWLHPGQAAVLRMGDSEAGWLGQLHPALARAQDFPSPVLVAELALEDMCERAIPAYRGLARFPSVRRDLALVVPESVPASALVDIIRETAGNILENCRIFDLYRGEGIEPGYKSLAIGLILRDVSRTLDDRAVDALVDRVVANLASRYQASLRG